ncbi:MAG: DNA alkylation repair protein [Balneolaceae bacterium]|nr:DNA alkylation repair protein [Balneolaceae bacterium]
MTYKPLKLWFDEDLASLLADKILKIRPDFNREEFIDIVGSRIPKLELNDRVEVLADGLYELLESDFSSSIPTLLGILGPENSEETGMFTNFYWVMPIAKFVEKYGLEHPELSYQAIEEITKRNTGEYAIRPFLVKYPAKTIAKMMNWSTSENLHVRRLASEGGRPRLPWAKKLDPFIEDPSPLLPILENLNADPSKYVQKSVANCLNDILKDNQEVARNEIEKWLPTDEPSTKWIIKHALRNELKKDEQWAKEIIASFK